MEIGRHASAHGIAAAVRHFVAQYPTLKKQTVFEFKSSYLKAKSKNGTEMKKLTTKARGRPKLLPEELMSKTIKTIKALRLRGAPVSVNVINAIAKGIVVANDRCLLVENGEGICS